MLSRIEAVEAEHLALYGGEAARFGAVQALYAAPDLPINVACGFGANLDALDEVEAFYAARPVPARLVVYSHFADWDTLARRGYRVVRLLHVYARALDALPAAPTLTVRPSEPAEFARISAEAFGPGSEAIVQRTSQRAQTQLYIAEQGGQPAAAGAMSVFGDLALLFGTATLPQFRGLGAQMALLAARRAAAAGSGATWAAVMTTPGSASERNIVRAGFALVGARLSAE
jgi:hypothetical protein